ncbi:MAG: M90 family metallopeptidase [Burkholderiaceae bacterium]
MQSWWKAWQRARRDRVLHRRSIPEPLWRLTLTRYGFLAGLDAPAAAELRELATLFLAEKEFFGADGLHVSDEMAVAIAAQACLPILRLGLHWYDGFKGIVVHADAVMAQREVVDEFGVVHEYEEELSGEAMEGGPLMLSWRDVQDSGASADWGYNVVIHEFAHILDMRDGVADGVPLLPDRGARERWTAVLDAQYREFCESVDQGLDTVLDPYGAESPDEFFAVATEAFFTVPSQARGAHPQLYALLAEFFRQDPAAAASA